MQFWQNFDFTIKTQARKTAIFGNSGFWKNSDFGRILVAANLAIQENSTCPF